MRIIKFRAWVKSKHKMFYPPESLNAVSNPIKTEFRNHYSKKVILMQSTNLKDRKGKEIWEGDVVKFHDCKGDPEVCCDENCPADIVLFGEAEQDGLRFVGFYLGDKKGVQGLFADFLLDEDKEILGNRYENPELL